MLGVVVWFVLIKTLRTDAATQRKLFFVIVTIQVLLFHALRDPFIFPDNAGYAKAFGEIRLKSFHEACIEQNNYTMWGRGYILLNWLLGRISSDFSILFFSTSCIMILCTFWFYYKTSYKMLFSSLAYLLYPFLFYQSMFVIRQHLAAAVLLLALLYIKRLKISIPLFVLAVLFHITAIVFAPFYFLYYYIKKISLIKMVIIGTLILLICNIGMVYFLQNFERYEHYQDISKSNTLPVLVMGSVLIVHLINRSFKYNLEDYDSIILKYLVYVTFVLVGLMGTGGGRLASYFIYIMPVALPMIFKYNQSMMIRKRIFGCIYFVALFYLWILLTENAEFINYNYIKI